VRPSPNIRLHRTAAAILLIYFHVPRVAAAGEPQNVRRPMEQSLADRIWNRAAIENGGARAQPGDLALAALLRAHGFIMNGGVHHGLECLSSQELVAAKDAYVLLGFEGVARLLEKATSLAEDVADEEYARLIPQDSAIDRGFANLYSRSPKLFAPVDPA